MRPELQKKIDFALKLLKSAEAMAAKVGQPVEICYSGGKDSDVILELARMSGINYRAIYKNTTIDPPGTIAHARANGVEVMQPAMTFRQIMEKKGMPNRWRRFCCGILKEYKVLDYAVVGIRRDESRARSDRYHEPEVCRVYSKRKGIKSRQYLPLLEWTKQDVAEFISERDIQCHALYYDEQGRFHADRRLGCMCCPLQSKPKRIAEFKRLPGMARFYLSAAKKYMETHPDNKITKLFNGNYYDWFVSQVWCDGERDFRSRFGATMFDKGVDTKAFLQRELNITL
jgi:phosphoadenosine phosphosulfate reductase